MFSVACSVGFASYKTFGKQPKHPCFGRSPKAGRRDASPRIHPRHGCRACIPNGSMQGRIQVVEQSRCRTHRQQTTTIAQMQSQPSIHSLSRGKGVFGKDAEIRTRQALHEAKPIECPKGDRDNKSEVNFKNRLFLQSTKFLYRNFYLYFFLPDSMRIRFYG